jgi:hypothetical protein
MLNLYYNTKLTKVSVQSKNFLHLTNFFHPAYFPSHFDTISVSSIDQCLFSIESLHALKFNRAIFNISLEVDEEKARKKIKNVILEKIKANNISVNWSRPATRGQWLKDVEQLEIVVGDEPVLVIMNHDHPLNPKYSNLFTKDVEKCFLINECHRVMSYSHCPEMLANHFNSGLKIQEKIFRKEITWFDSLYLMRAKTLKLLFENLVVPYEEFYLGRIDWPGVYIKPTVLEFFICTKPYFYHLGSYQHINGINIKQFCKSNSIYIYSQGKNIGDAYCEWLTHYYLYLFKFFKKKKPRILRREIYFSLQHYFSYAKSENSNLNVLEKEGLISLAFSTFNSLYNLFDIESEIAGKNFLLRYLFPFRAKVILKKWLKRTGIYN